MNGQASNCNACGSWWRLPLLLAFVLAAVWFWRDHGLREVAPEDEITTPLAPTKEAAGQGVSLAIDFGDGRRTEFAPIGWREGMTVYELMRETPRKHQGLMVRGTGELAFLTSLDGVENEGADGRNWTYTLNGKIGDRSFAVCELRPGDQVLWTFGRQQ